MKDLLLKNAFPPFRKTPEMLDLHIEDGRIKTWGKNLNIPGIETKDCEGWLVLPGFVDGHVHLDKTVWGDPWIPSALPPVPALSDLVLNERRLRVERRHDPRVYAPRLLDHMFRLGTVALRSHIDVDPTTKLDGVRALLEVREHYRDKMDIELVAFPQSGILTCPGVGDLLNEAMGMGLDAIGGLDPAAFDRDPAGHLDIVFRIAAQHGSKIDIHLHEPGVLGALSIELIAECTKKFGLQGRVTLSHAFALGGVDSDRFKKLLDLLVENKISVVTSAPGASDFAPHQPLLDAGVVYALGSDNIRDFWAPFGNGDMLDRALQLAIRRRLRRDDQIEQALKMATFEGAKLLGLKDYGIKPGCRANLVLVKASCVAEAVVTCPQERVLIRS